jgi:hypothetical protein
MGDQFKNSLYAFTNDSLNQKISHDEILDRITKIPLSEAIPWDAGVSYYTADLVSYNGTAYECLVDHFGGERPANSPDYWNPIDLKPGYFAAPEYTNFYLHYDVTINEKGQILNRIPFAATVLVFNDLTGIFHPIMTIDIDTLKKILLDKTVGTSGKQFWDRIINEKLTGFYLDNRPIRKTK